MFPPAAFVRRDVGLLSGRVLPALLWQARTAEGSWRWVERHNRATAHPTDFGLLRLADDGETLQALRSALKGAAFVRSITPQQRITRSLLARAMGGEGTRQQQRQQQQQQQHEEEEEAHPVKGPGRLQTKSSYEVHEEDAHGAFRLPPLALHARVVAIAVDPPRRFEAQGC
jgi:hypothetical protein